MSAAVAPLQGWADAGACENVNGRLKKTVALIGMMGAGKTAVGGALARMLGVAFIDSDDEIVKAANLSIPEIFARDGEAFFRRKETQVLTRLLEGPACILSTGGGAFMSQENRGLIAAKGVSVWLKADVELLWARVRQRSTRPLLRTANPKATLRALLAERAPVYGLADLTVEAEPENSVEASARKVLAALATRADVLEGWE